MEILRSPVANTSTQLPPPKHGRLSEGSCVADSRRRALPGCVALSAPPSSAASRCTRGLGARKSRSPRKSDEVEVKETREISSGWSKEPTRYRHHVAAVCLQCVPYDVP
eukprot:6177307-Pleurochrysis_carterae.AAC.1